VESSSHTSHSNNHDDNNNDNDNQGTIRSLIQYIIKLAKYDNESQRILHLAIPFMTNSFMKTLADLILLAIVSQSLGTDSMIAYAMVEVVVGVSSSFMMGWIETINSLGAMAQGAGNYELVGKHIQIAILAYVICQVSTAFIWGFSMHSIMLLFGFDENTANISKGYVWVYIADRIMFGIFQAFIDFLGLIDRERLGMVFSCFCNLSKVALVAIELKIKEDTTLTIVGLTVLANTCLYVCLTITISSRKQLTRPYEYGLIGELSFRNRAVVNALVKTGLPLAVGGLLAYAEWEILTIFAAVLGPAEAATWAILGFVWDVFESTTEAIGDASEIRCAYQLGKGRPEMAKLSAYKSMLLSLVVAAIITTLFLLMSGYLPEWLTTDETIQEMLIELFPLLGLGNVTMTVGMGKCGDPFCFDVHLWYILSLIRCH
jgi:Na+-driven multidrug efflux pump